jgi:hypothetical protein
MAKKKNTFQLDMETFRMLAKHQNDALQKFFDKNIEKVLKKKSLHSIITYCYKVGYWNGMTDTIKDKELCQVAERIVEEIKKQAEDGEKE